MGAGSKAVQNAKIAFPKVPISTPHSFLGSYRSFLKSVCQNTPNKTFASMKKSAIDLEFETQLSNALGDRPLVERYMQQGAKSEAAEKQFSHLQAFGRSQAGRLELNPEIKSLNLPEVGRHPKASGASVYEMQTYADFASKAEKRNPQFEFTRGTMDEAFEYSASRLHAGVKNAKGQHDRMLTRCLGKESEDYWKGR